MRTLVAYFSKTGKTKDAAERIAAQTNGTLFQIKTEKSYEGSYLHTLGVARKEFSSKEYPAITWQVRGFDTYDRIILGFPIWFGTCPRAVLSFLQGYDFTGKTILPFCTSGLNGPGKATEEIKAACPTASVLEGVRVNKCSDQELAGLFCAP